MDEDAPVAGDDVEVIDGLGAPFAADALERQVVGADAVQPVGVARDAQAGFIGVQRRRGEQGLDGGRLPPGQGRTQAREPGRQGGLGDGAPGQRIEGLCGALEGERRRAQEVAGERHDAVAVLQGPRHVVGKPPAGLGPATRTGLYLGLDNQLTGLKDDIDLHAPLTAAGADAFKVMPAGPARADRGRAGLDHHAG